MIRRAADLAWESRTRIRGGEGAAQGASYLEAGAMAGILGAGRTTLEPGASVGEHLHPDTEEFYLILEGRGTGLLDGERFPVGPGDLWVTRAGHSHGLINDSEAPLTFLGVLTRIDR